MSDETESIYRDRIYSAYVTGRDKSLAPDETNGLRSRLPYFLSLIRRHFPKRADTSILDLGCGHGALLYALSIAGYKDARGVDRSAEQVAAAERLGIGGVTQNDLMAELRGLEDECVDLVVSFDVLEHFKKDELVPFVDEVRRVLRPRGRWILHVPNGESPFVGRVRYGDLTHELAFTRGSLRQLLMTSGFQSVECYEDRPVVHGLLSGVRAILWRVIRLLLISYIAVETGMVERDAAFSQNLVAVALRTS